MKYVSIDIETTGLDSERCQILSMGAIIEDTKIKYSFDVIPKFHAILAHDFIQGEPYALNMNKELIQAINNWHMAKTNEQRDALVKKMNAIFIPPDALIGQFMRFLDIHNLGDVRINVAGKNFGSLDKRFLEKMPLFNQLTLGHRAIDPAMPFVNWSTDEVLPSLDECKIRAGVAGLVSHNALEDAWDVIQVLRSDY